MYQVIRDAERFVYTLFQNNVHINDPVYASEWHSATLPPIQAMLLYAKGPVDIHCHQFEATKCTTAMTSYEALASKVSNTLAIKLISIILSKKTNLCVSIDVTSPKELISTIQKVGPHVCIVKVLLMSPHG
jgi:Orotidine 5'-phosphate decarboxylase / HUMPS family